MWSPRLNRSSRGSALVLASLMCSVALAQQPVDATPPAEPAPVRPEPRSYPARAIAEFSRAVSLAKSGDATEAELEFGQLAVAYPNYAGPQINIGLLRRKAGNLEGAEQALRLATERNPASALAWTELGVTLRMLGRFPDAASAYERAIAADPSFAPAQRNLAVVLDLYLDQPAPALAALERYRTLAGEDKKVTGWIAELRQRVNRAAAPKPEEPTT